MCVTDIDNIFFPLWRELFHQARSKGVCCNDAEELVSESVIKGIELFDPVRGELLPFCRSILNNGIKNYWRDRWSLEALAEECTDEFSPGPLEQLLVDEEGRGMKEIVNSIRSMLTDEEAEFFSLYGEVIEEVGERAVSETARRLHIAPLKGHDIFRRIQRKARKIYSTNKTPPFQIVRYSQKNSKVARMSNKVAEPGMLPVSELIQVDHAAEFCSYITMKGNISSDLQFKLEKILTRKNASQISPFADDL